MQNIAIIDIYYYLGIFMSAAIIILFSMSFVYGILYQKKKKLKMLETWVHVYITFVSFLWILIFSYVLFKDIIGVPILYPCSFGGMFIRPVILMTATGTMISQRTRYNIVKKYFGDKP